MLKYRIITALILIPIFIALVIKLSPIGFCIFTGAIVLWGAWEWSAFLGFKKPWIKFIYVLAVLMLLVGSFEIPVSYVLYVALFWWIFAFILVFLYSKRPFALYKPIWVALMGFLVLIPCWLAINYIRNAGEGSYYLQNLTLGQFNILYLFVLIWGADTGAYFVGRSWGKHKLAPTVSPGKTIEGSIGGLVTTVIIAVATLYFTRTDTSIWLAVIVLSIVTVLFSILGDLFESMLKRGAGIKDSGTLLPGHGGLLDRIDSLTAAAPIFALGLTFIGKFFQ